MQPLCTYLSLERDDLICTNTTHIINCQVRFFTKVSFGTDAKVPRCQSQSQMMSFTKKKKRKIGICAFIARLQMQIRLYSQRYRSRSARLRADYRDSCGSARSVPAGRETRVEPHTRNSNVDEQLVANSLNPGFCGEQSTQSKSCSRVWGRRRDQYVLLHVRALGTQGHESTEFTL